MSEPKANPAIKDVEVGDQVKHPAFGVGTILFKSGIDDKAKVIIAFQDHGQKKLLLKYAKLKRFTDDTDEE